MESLIGKKFSKLKILSLFRKDGRIYFVCQCQCGNRKDIYKQAITSGHTRSCGCIRSISSSRRMKKKNPMWMPGIKEKAIATNKALGTRPLIRGGNGKELPLAQRTLLVALGKGWYAEHSVPTFLRGKTEENYPTCYKIDIANPKTKVGIEVDGRTHNFFKRKEQDKKKTKFLEKNGWKVFRFKNEEVMSNLDEVLNEIT